MGVPKFFRYMSERYPTLSQLVQEFEIPQFDNLYLDMNGIIHPCSHPNDFDPHFRITDKSIFEAIFHYIEFLFKTIKPQKLFFLAVDGVAPRAKMNQQRGRRFRSAKEAEVLEEQARKNGEVLPSAKRFDSNCITPGTIFMDNLHKQLQYFITMKISSDPLWQKCQIILSGHDTPGEGEHKIMDYIRYLKTQPDYDCNTRHCLYGLDADLIMLGMCTHDPNFCLLREEVKYTRTKSKRIVTPEETNFYLLHLSLLRDYLDIEFGLLKTSLQFKYDLESIIDDWVLMGFLVGNDFIPHLPDLHINTGAFPVLFQAYKDVLPTLDGYLNEGGYLNVKRFQIYLNRIAEADFERFEEKYADLAFLEEKLTKGPVDIRDEIDEKKPPKSAALEQLIAETDEMFPTDDSDSEAQDKNTMMDEFKQHKRDYYRTKLEYEDVTEEVLKSQAEGYIRAIQWVLHYYYHGCQSWSWFYPHHYSPFVSDVANFSDFNLEFDMGKPFLPFHQLLAVLPPGSKDLLPETFQRLMVDESSPIKDFYPLDFATDLNGKVQEWEAIVLIPFIDEQRLLLAMEACQNELTEDEVRRNSHGPMQLFHYTPNNLGPYRSELFTTIAENHAEVRKVTSHEVGVDLSMLSHRPGDGFDKTLYIPGFSSLRFIDFDSFIKRVNIRVFDRNIVCECIILTIKKTDEANVRSVAEKLLGQVVYVGWPHMVQARVFCIADSSGKYSLDKADKIEKIDYTGKESEQWLNVVDALQNAHREKRGIVVKDVDITVHVRRAQGERVVINDTDLHFETNWSKHEETYALQTIVTDIKVLPASQPIPKTLEEAYPVGSKVIVLVQPNYGAVGEVIAVPESSKDGIKLSITQTSDPIVNKSKLLAMKRNREFMPATAACRRLSLNLSVFNRITGTCYFKCGEKRFNIGLNLKYNKTNQEVPGFTKKDNGTWLYSDRTVELVNNYWDKFPEIFDYLNTNQSSDFSLEDIYDSETGKGKDREIAKWIAEQDHVSISPVTCGSQLLSPEAVQNLETAVMEHNPDETKCVLKIKPSYLYKSDLVFGNIIPTVCTNELLDRVVCCRYSHNVPFGLKGFIIGIYKAAEGQIPTYDVLFDEPFYGGQGLLGATQKCVAVMSASCFANISGAARSNPVLKIQKNILRDVTTNQSPARNNNVPQTVPQPTTPSAFASVTQVNNPTRPILANGSAVRPDPKFSNMWRNMQKPAEALMEALNINKPTEKASQPTLQNPCLTLMSYFERSPMGCPKYQYHQQGNAFVAEVTLPNGQRFSGVPFPSKADAGESAALQALAVLGQKPKYHHQFNEVSQPNLCPQLGPPHPLWGQPSRPCLYPPSNPPPAPMFSLRPEISLAPGPPMPPPDWRRQKPPTLWTPDAGRSMSMPFVPLQAIRQNRRIDPKPKPVLIKQPEIPQPPHGTLPQPSHAVQEKKTITEKPTRKKRQIAARFDYS